MFANRESPAKEYQTQIRLFKVLTHPARLAILDILREGEECVCHLEAALGYRQAYISQQLMVLRDAGLVQDRREGWNIFYRVTRPEIFAVIEAVSAVTVGGRPQGSRPPQVARPNICPCPHCAPEAQPASPQSGIEDQPRSGRSASLAAEA